MRFTFVTRKFGNVERNSHCDVLHFTPVRVASLFLDCNGVLAIKAYCLNVNFNVATCLCCQGDNVEELEEAIIALSEVMEVKADPAGFADGTVIESKFDVGRG